MDLYERHTAGCTKIRPRRFCLGYSVVDIDKQSKLLCDFPNPHHTHRHVSLFAQHITFSTLWVLSELSDDSLLDVSAYYYGHPPLSPPALLPPVLVSECWCD